MIKQTARYDCWKSVFSKSSKNEQAHFWNIFNTLEKIATESDVSDAPENVTNNNESGIQINNNPDSVRGPKVFMF
jgi:hypothetical protein